MKKELLISLILFWAFGETGFTQTPSKRIIDSVYQAGKVDYTNNQYDNALKNFYAVKIYYFERRSEPGVKSFYLKLDSSINNCTKAIADFQRSVSTLQAKLADAEKKKNDAEVKLNQCKSENLYINATIAGMKNDYNHLKFDIDALKKERINK